MHKTHKLVDLIDYLESMGKDIYGEAVLSLGMTACSVVFECYCGRKAQ